MIKTLTVSAASLATASTVIAGAGELNGLDVCDSIMVVASLQGVTGGTLDVYLQVAVDTSATSPTWVDYAHFPQLAAGAAATTLAFTVSRQGQQLSFLTVGTGTSVALAANTIVGGDFGERMRVVFVVGAGASAGAAQTIRIFGSAAKRRV